MLNRKNTLLALIATAALLFITGCASKPDVYSNQDSAINLASYKTYAFYNKPATDHEGYSTLSTKFFKDAITSEMARLGYQFSENNPDLEVNFSLNIEEKSRVESFNASVGFHRHGWFGSWPIYDNDVRTVTYKEGLFSIDIIDSGENRSVWESTLEKRLDSEELDNLESTIRSATTEIFKKHPLAPPQQ